ncbi:hypothetical protein GN244_ATG10603 [Phytophthora infestans]|uniref:Uncharacterized protein n=1 Tax=Phytophthora infestans TaxID=4787 RepID=A0A833T4D6_PHYIN|nr:hypothetical protein GN244_ATG10603 [Phytophthora infestans]KAF4131490.1 hypothetical protein GN958_ATG19319 [Phytophthora infestans]
MTAVYQLWLKKREFKAPRQPLSPAEKPTFSSSVVLTNKSIQDHNSSSEAACRLLQANPSKLHSVSGVETTQVTVKPIAKPPAVRKRHTFSLEEDAYIKDPTHDAKPAGWKRQRRDNKNVPKPTRLKFPGATGPSRQPCTSRKGERAIWSGSVDEDSKVAAGDTCERKVATALKGSLVKSCSAAARRPQLNFSIRQSEMETKKKRSSGDSAIEDTVTKRLRFYKNPEASDQVVELSAFPPTSPMKKLQKKIRTAMLDESQYWMAVDRFSHLT